MEWWTSRVPAPLRDNLGLVVSMMLAVLVTVRVLAVAGYRVEIAAIVLQTQGTSSVLIGTLLPSFVSLVWVLAIFLTHFVVRRGVPNTRDYQLLYAGSLILALLAITMLPVYFAVLVVPVGVVLAIGLGVALTFIVRRRPGGPGGDPHCEAKRVRAPHKLLLVLGRAAVASAVIGLASTTLIDTRAWMPIEEVTQRDGSSVVGYVLEERGSSFVVLRASRRGVVEVAKPAQRRYCTASPGRWYQTPAELIVGTHPLPACSD